MVAGGPDTHGSSEGTEMSTDVVGEDRLAAVRRYEILDTPRDGAFDPVARIAATVFGTPIATVTIVDADRVWFAACEGLDGVSQIGVEPGLCASAVLQDGPYVVNDAAVDPRTIDHPLVRGALGLRFYAAAPITTRDGHRLGTVNVIDSEPREVTPAQAAVLSELAAVVMQQLELRLSAIRAVRAERELRAEADERAERAARLAEQMRVAAAAASAREHPSACELGGRRPCAKPAELKVADSWGDSAWACTAHAEEVILQVPSVFVADEALGGLAAYVRR